MRIIALVSLGLLVAACVPPRTQAEACRRRAAAGRLSRATHPSPVANAIEDANCDEIERQERGELAAENARITATRQAPIVPELDATPVEARALCFRQGATFRRFRRGYICEMRGGRLFDFTPGPSGRLATVRGYYEDMSIEQAVAAMRKSLGDPQDERVSSSGFRSFIWRRAGRIVVVTMNARAAILLVRRAK